MSIGARERLGGESRKAETITKKSRSVVETLGSTSRLLWFRRIHRLQSNGLVLRSFFGTNHEDYRKQTMQQSATCVSCGLNFDAPGSGVQKPLRWYKPTPEETQP
jgi:hypothetical protein